MSIHYPKIRQYVWTLPIILGLMVLSLMVAGLSNSVVLAEEPALAVAPAHPVTDTSSALALLQRAALQTNTPSFVDSGQALGSHFTWAVPLGDLDGDGDLDALIGNEGINQIWQNDGNGNFSDSGQALGNASTRAVALGDLDGDGDLDAFEGTTLTNTVWLNDGDGNFTDSGQTLGNTNTWAVALGDLDEDGDLDAFVGNNFGASFGLPNEVWLNQGDGTFTDSGQLLGSDKTNSVSLGDLDGDGDLDAFVGNCCSNPNQVWLNDGSGSFTNSGQNLGYYFTRSVALGDLDSDGDLDVFMGVIDVPSLPECAVCHLPKPPTGLPENRVWFNDGNGSFSDSGQALGFEFSWGVALGDLDGDGDLDAFAGNSTADLVWVNDGTGTFVDSGGTFGLSDARTVSLGDLDGDGDLDAFVGNCCNAPNSVWLNAGRGTFTDSGQTMGDSDTMSVALGDLDGDGDLDALAGNGNVVAKTANTVWLNTGVGTFISGDSWGNSDSNSVSLGDLDGDHDLDAFVGNIGANRVWTNDGDGNFSDSGQALGSADTRSIALGDLDGDGDLDAFAGDDGPNRVWVNDGNAAFANSGQTLGNSDTRSIALGDLDGDGDLDAFAGNGSGQPNHVWLNAGNGTFSESGQALGTAHTWAVALGDLDGDGDLDAFSGNNFAPDQIWLNNGNGTFIDSGQTLGNYFTYAVALSDLDGDGDLDAISGNNFGQANRIWLNAGDGTLIDSGDELGSADTQAVALGDLNGDGDLDAFVGNGSEQPNQVYLRQSARELDLLVITQKPGTPPDANFFASTEILESQFITIPYSLFGRGIGSMGRVEAFYSMDGGDNWEPALATESIKDVAAGKPNDITTLFASNNGFDGNMFDVTAKGGDVFLTGFDININSTASTMVEIYYKPGTYVGSETNASAWVSLGSQTVMGGGLDNPTHFNIGGLLIPSGQTFGFYIHALGVMRYTNGANSFADSNIRVDLGIGLGGLFGTDGIFSPRTWNGTIYYKTIASHEYHWDTFASGFFGQSDNVVLRLVAYPQSTPSSIMGTYHYTNSIPGPFLWPYASTTTFPFRMRGTQVRVSDGSNPVSGALVYHLPADQTSEAQPLSGAGSPFRTDQHGYLQGRGRLENGDHLVALLPISATESYTLYHTSAAPTLNGLDAYEVTTPGVQELTVSSSNPLLLYNLDISLEWDARSDTTFLSDLEVNLQHASEVLYDVTNGQAALGKVTVYHSKQNWLSADMVMYARNNIRPRANQGGVVDEVTDDVGLSGVIENAFLPGQVSMGPIWDPFGENQFDLGEDWWRTLAHELAHYLFYLPDNYVGIGAQGLLNLDCKGSFMTNSTDDSYSEFLTDVQWSSDADCQQTVAALTTGRSDWETVTAFYDMLSGSSGNPGPSILPLAVTQVDFVEPDEPPTAITTRNFDLRDADDGQIVLAPLAQGYLIQTQGTPADLSDDVLVNLGSSRAGGDRIKVRGAEPGDRVCVTDLQSSTPRLGCEDVIATSASVSLADTPGWQPSILVSPVSSTTLQITAELAEAVSGQVSVQVYPATGSPENPDLPVEAPVRTMNQVDSLRYERQVALDYPAFNGHVRVWVEGMDPELMAVTEFTLDGSIWGGQSRAWAGGQSRAWAGGQSRAWAGAPSVSGDGQITVLNLEDPFADTGVSTMQSLTAIPDLPDWLALVGQAYQVSVQPTFTPTVKRSITFDYLQRDVPDGHERDLSIYFFPDGGSGWQRLETGLSDEDNRATAQFPTGGGGVYALIATVVLPSFDVGWNNFGYPIAETRPVTRALASIDGSYTSVYHYDSATGAWLLYDATVLPEFDRLVNDLETLEFGKGYWLYATQAITAYLGIESDALRSPIEGDPIGIPATYYGNVTSSEDFTSKAGMTVVAMVGNVVCGQSSVVAHSGQLAYKVQVRADADDGCGEAGLQVKFYLDGRPMEPQPQWDRTQAQFVPLAPGSYGLYLPFVVR